MQSDDSPQTVHFVPLPPVASLAKSTCLAVGVGHHRSPSHTTTSCCGARIRHCPPPRYHRLPPSEPLSLSCIRLTAARNKQWVLTVGVIYVMSMTDTRTCKTTKSFKIGSALTLTRVNVTRSQMRRQYTLMGILDTQRGSQVRESCAIG